MMARSTKGPEEEILDVLPYLKEKFVVDFANSIDVLRDHLRVQSQRTGMMARLMDSLTGHGARRQNEIDELQVAGIEGALCWLQELTHDMARSELAIARVNQHLKMLNNQVGEIAGFSIETRQQLEELASAVDRRCAQLEQELRRVEREQRAHLHVERAFARWEAGRFGGLSPAGRCYAVFEDLRWGHFGTCWRSSDAGIKADLLAYVVDRATIYLAKDVTVALDDRVETRSHWLAPAAAGRALPYGEEALAYLGDWALVERFPLTHVITQRHAKWPAEVPRLSDARRIATMLVSEVMEDSD